MPYDLNLLPVFIALMDERSVTRAAMRLGMTQPALSNALGRLRTMLQDPLFVRERYGIRPTAAALELAPRIVEALAMLDEAVLAQQGFDPTTAKRLFTIAATGYVELAVLPAIVAALKVAAPNITLRFIPYGTDLAETGIVSGTTAVVLGRLVDPPDSLVVQRLMDDGLGCVVRADHPAVGARLTRKQFERLRHVNVLPSGRLRAGVFQALAKQKLSRDVAISVTNFFAAAEMVAVTDHCATLPTLVCRHLARDPRFKVLPAPVDLGTFPVEMAWHVRYRNDAAHRWLRELVEREVKKLARSRGLPLRDAR